MQKKRFHGLLNQVNLAPSFVNDAEGMLNEIALKSRKEELIEFIKEVMG